MFEGTLSIDLGASFTKVAWRKPCRPRFGHLSSETAQVLAVDGSALIPSVAIRTGRSDQPWLFGMNAALMRPGPRMEVFRNWKADLFQAANNRDSAAAAVVAQSFFRWLRSEIYKEAPDFRDARVTVAMPAFRKFEENAAVLLRCMSLAGWDDVEAIRITEPHANLIGLMARGVSVVRMNRDGDPFIDYGRMFGQSSPFVRAAREYSLHSSGPSRLGVLVVDVGAFTTDFAHLTFDFTDDDHLGDGLSALRQESVAHGVINQLDEPLFATLAKRHQVDWKLVSLSEIELVKEALYAGKSYDLLTQDGRVVHLGDAEDVATIRENVRRFASTVWSHARQFIGNAPIQLAYQTGGGTLIEGVRDELGRELKAARIRYIPLPRRQATPEVTRWRQWTDSDGGLERLATALGGTSVVLEVSEEPDSSARSRVISRPPPLPRAPTPVTCRCGGLNPDCTFCGGRGYT